MKIQPILFIACILFIGVWSCTSPAAEQAPPPDLTKVKADLQVMENAFAAALKAKDADAVVVYYADNAVSMPNNHTTVTGKPAILNRIKEEIAKDTTGTTMVFEVQDVMAAGDYFIEIGKSTGTDAKGKMTTGKWISIFQKRDGKYVCVRDIFNNDAPSETK